MLRSLWKFHCMPINNHKGNFLVTVKWWFVWQSLENRREEARAYSNLGSAYHSQRDFDKAISYHTRVLELAQELVDRAIEMRAYAGLGHAARCMQVGI